MKFNFIYIFLFLLSNKITNSFIKQKIKKISPNLIKHNLLVSTKLNSQSLNKDNNHNNQNNYNNYNNYNNHNNDNNKINKIDGFLSIIRYKNILPTLYLLLTGSWIVNPNFNNLCNLLNSKTLLFSSINTILILMSNMIINDILDINIDKINNPTRPLITGDIKLNEAYFLLIFFLAITEFINIYFLPINLQYIIHLSLLYTFIYTPILKKIPLIKNLSCATIVSSSIYVGGLATITNMNINTNLNTNININLLYQSILLVFLGSLYNEILLDISDYDGDKKNNIFTIATIFGKNISLLISKKILEFNIFINTLLIYNFGYINYSLLFIITSLPILYDFYKIKINNYQKDDIRNTFTTSSNQMVFMLLIICLISK